MSILDELQAIVILDSQSILGIRKYISRKYPNATLVQKAHILADAIRRVVNGSVPEVSQDQRLIIQTEILEAFISNQNRGISAADVFIKCLERKTYGNLSFAKLAGWMEKLLRRHISVMNLSEFVSMVYQKAQQDNSKNLYDIIRDVEQTPEGACLLDGIHAACSHDTKSFGTSRNAQAYVEQAGEVSCAADMYRGESNINLPEDTSAVVVLIKSSVIRFGYRYQKALLCLLAGCAVFLMVLLLKPGAVKKPLEFTKTLREAVNYGYNDINAMLGYDAEYTPPPINMSNVKQKLNMKATAYDLSLESCGKTRQHPAYGITYTGTRAKAGRTVAVDPKVIPLGSRLYIVFPHPYKHMDGEYIAEDTGSRIKGNVIDIFMGEDKEGERVIYKKAMKFGIRQVEAYLLKEMETDEELKQYMQYRHYRNYTK